MLLAQNEYDYDAWSLELVLSEVSDSFWASCSVFRLLLFHARLI